MTSSTFRTPSWLTTIRLTSRLSNAFAAGFGPSPRTGGAIPPRVSETSQRLELVRTSPSEVLAVGSESEIQRFRWASPIGLSPGAIWKPTNFAPLEIPHQKIPFDSVIRIVLAFSPPQFQMTLPRTWKAYRCTPHGSTARLFRPAWSRRLGSRHRYASTVCTQ
jgi:hypothetical protein